VKNHDFTPKNHIFSNFRGGALRVRPPLDPPLLIDIKNTSYSFRYQNKAALPQVRTTSFGLQSFRYALRCKALE
jgi:hypothetical protein